MNLNLLYYILPEYDKGSRSERGISTTCFLKSITSIMPLLIKEVDTTNLQNIYTVRAKNTFRIHNFLVSFTKIQCWPVSKLLNHVNADSSNV